MPDPNKPQPENRDDLMKNKSLKNFQDLSRLPVVNHVRSALAATGRPPLHTIRIFERSALWEWITSYLGHVFGKNYPFPGTDTAPNKTSTYTIPDTLRVSIAGDWGTGTEEAATVATQMMIWDDAVDTDLSIHLGDVYYVGDEKELKENCLGGAGVKNPDAKVKWPIGRLGSFALNGNHEMYANGTAYFKTFLPQLGWKDAAGNLPGQGPSFFCLENANWRVIGIDTGYNSVGIPIIEKIPWFEADCKLDDELIRWLREVVRPHLTPKATVLLSHHQCFSAFEGDYPKPAEQLAEFFPARTVLWLWGHEHRFAGYKQAGAGEDKFQIHGRCIGHGGMPVDATGPKDDSEHHDNLWFYDRRINPRYQEDELGFNGFAQLKFEGQILKIGYYTLALANGNAYAVKPDLLVEEQFTASGANVVSSGFTPKQISSVGVVVK